jgi:hypothetical protein
MSKLYHHKSYDYDYVNHKSYDYGLEDIWPEGYQVGLPN